MSNKSINPDKTYTTEQVMQIFGITKADVYRLGDKVAHIAGRPNRYWGWSLIEYLKSKENKNQ